MYDILASPVLALNRAYQPVGLTTVRRAVVLLYAGHAHAVDGGGDSYDFDLWRLLPVRTEDEAIPVVGGVLRAPRVLHLHEVERMPRLRVKLSRRNIMLRDDYQCQYCSRRLAMRDLNLDHVMPRSRGGPATWENLVTACRRCNLVKGHRTPDEAGMRLLRKPHRPRWSNARILLLTSRSEAYDSERVPFSEWEPFLLAG